MSLTFEGSESIGDELRRSHEGLRRVTTPTSTSTKLKLGTSAPGRRSTDCPSLDLGPSDLYSKSMRAMTMTAQRNARSLEPLRPEERMELRWEGVSAWVPDAARGAEPGPASASAAKWAWGKTNEREGTEPATAPPKSKRNASNPGDGRPTDAGDAETCLGSEPSLTVSAADGPDGPDNQGSGSGSAGLRRILCDLDGIARPGEVLALMGPSGSGKTSLLSALAGRGRFARREGVTTFAGRPLDAAARRRVGYVSQDDLLYPSLTVYETLRYTALLKLPRSMSLEAKLERVEAVLVALGLRSCRDTVVGEAGAAGGGAAGASGARGVSGGERRRVSVGVELLLNPSVLFLDEPTSGLDATTALRLVHTLKTLAVDGRTVVMTIHQPGSRLFQELDRVLLLSHGRTVYQGEGSRALEWFAGPEAGGWRCPPGLAAADFMLDLADGAGVAGGGDGGDMDTDADGNDSDDENEPLAARSKRGAIELAMRFRSRFVNAPGLSETQRLHRRLRGYPAGAEGGDLEAGASAGLATTTAPTAGLTGPAQSRASRRSDASMVLEPSGPGPAWLQQVYLLAHRAVRLRRSEALSGQRIVQVIGVGVLAGAFWFQRCGADSSIQIEDTGGLLFLLVLFMAFASLFQALFTFPSDYRMVLKERARRGHRGARTRCRCAFSLHRRPPPPPPPPLSGLYSLSAYYFARTAADAPLDALLPSLYVAVAYWMGGLRPDAWAFVAQTGIVLLVVFVAQSYGMLLGALFMNPRSAQTAATVLMLALMLVGGFYTSDVPSGVRWFRSLSFIYYAFNAALSVEFGYGRDIPMGAWPDAYPEPSSLSTVADTGALLAMLILLRVAAFAALWWRTRDAGGVGGARGPSTGGAMR